MSCILPLIRRNFRKIWQVDELIEKYKNGLKKIWTQDSREKIEYFIKERSDSLMCFPG